MVTKNRRRRKTLCLVNHRSYSTYYICEFSFIRLFVESSFRTGPFLLFRELEIFLFCLLLSLLKHFSYSMIVAFVIFPPSFLGKMQIVHLTLRQTSRSDFRIMLSKWKPTLFIFLLYAWPFYCLWIGFQREIPVSRFWPRDGGIERFYHLALVEHRNGNVGTLEVLLRYQLWFSFSWLSR